MTTEKYKRLSLDVFLAAPGFEDQAGNALCPICHDFLEDPTETNCGSRHTFCEPCIELVFAEGSPGDCPCCRGQFTRLEKSKGIVKSLIEHVKWMCPNHERGCCFIGTKRQLEKHLDGECEQHEKECPFDGCTESVKNDLLPQHKAVCEHRPVACTYCKKKFRFNVMEIHHVICDKFPLPCPNECGQTLPRKEVENHCKTECPEVVVPCVFPGCGEMVKKKFMSMHEEESTKKHLNLLLQKIDHVESTDSMEFTIHLPDFKKKAQGMQREDALESVAFAFQGVPFSLHVYPWGDSDSKENWAAVYLIKLEDYRGYLTYDIELIKSNGMHRLEEIADFSDVNVFCGYGQFNFCRPEALFSAARKTTVGALGFRVRLSAPKSNRKCRVISGYASK
uniref:RING-type domain-containing protein n=1 Tax=Chromera velia CCMP2878 TaxID=1169474 RepID=A0A0G4HFC0_9ALVE|eukprot:Cvel_26908.t1-p1 / transcript=Cvel_26908.t1 / gene=Cvel_26908 / organism=Chromera_velia_CCMP2878 / gene_product=TNF receptor-associated factor 2, putative / transcript_product=TNF receptor-associated factor 2, putative / location=Cvel_scaffold3271:11149-13688(+) / protein_length=392 / sequence_SO=supercontig / SO=protein_coding / is_pseudo=false